jgi:heterodisulfide reductase subunit A-like polyferredoxin
VEKERTEQLLKSFQDGNPFDTPVATPTYRRDQFGDVMVVGGGISGIQASLDLAAAGFKVYLVDKSPTVGGHMAQLDKTFPTNECST